MNTSAKKIYSLALILTGIFTLICTFFYTFALLAEYSSLSGHFEAGVFSDIFLPLLYMLAFVMFAVLGIVFRDTLSGRESKVTLPLLFAAGFTGLSVAVWFVTFLLDFFGTPFSPIATVFGILLAILGLATVVYFVSCALPFASHRQTVLFGMTAAAFMLMYAFFAYFDTAFALNSPIKLLDQITAIVLLFFFLAEIRFRFGAISEALFIPVCMLSTVLSASCGISALIYNVVTGVPLVGNVMHDFLLFGMAVYTFIRLLSFRLPALHTKEEDALPVMPAFETEEVSSAQTVSPKQETFDFDSSDARQDADMNREAGEAQEAALDFDESEKR